MQHRFRLREAVLPLFTAAVLLAGFVFAGLTQFYLPLLAGALVAAALAHRARYSLAEIGRGVWSGIKSTLIALSILVLIGGLIGVWKASGTVPAMVYYGLGLADPRYLVPVAFLLALVISMMLGTSIGTLSTLGVAIIGVAQGVGVSVPLVAGALVSGALFGDRSSPLSGSLNLNVSMTGTDLRKVMGTLLPTGSIAAGLSLLVYLGLGLWQPAGVAGAGSGLQQTLAAHMVVSPWLLFPPVLVLLLAFFRVPVRWALGAGMVVGALIAAMIGGVDLLTSAKAWLLGYQAHTGNLALDHMLSGGGILPMYDVVILIVVAGGFNGIMEMTGMMPMVIEKLVEGVRRPLALVASTMAISTSIALISANQALPIIISGRMLKPSYERAGVSPLILSRSLADSGTVLVGLIPWNMFGILATAALGVSVRSFAPYAVFLWLLPVVSLAKTTIDERNR